jgi:hypothetical protein
MFQAGLELLVHLTVGRERFLRIRGVFVARRGIELLSHGYPSIEPKQRRAGETGSTSTLAKRDAPCIRDDKISIDAAGTFLVPSLSAKTVP